MEVGEVRRRTTLSEQLAVLQSSNLRDLLKVREDEEEGVTSAAGHWPRCGGGVGREVLTLGAVLASEKRETASSTVAFSSPAGGRTLFEIIREEEEEEAGGAAVPGWRALRDLLRLGRASDPPADPSFENTEISAREDDGIQQEEVSERREEAGESSGGEAGAEERPVRVSLMALLEEADRQGGGGGGGGLLTVAELDAATVEAVEDKEGTAAGKGTCVCCVCMVRDKGAAFIPCGHTFCRGCARELWASRGTCPLCNGLILDVLDIF